MALDNDDEMPDIAEREESMVDPDTEETTVDPETEEAAVDPESQSSVMSESVKPRKRKHLDVRVVWYCLII